MILTADTLHLRLTKSKFRSANVRIDIRPGRGKFITWSFEGKVYKRLFHNGEYIYRLIFSVQMLERCYIRNPESHIHYIYLKFFHVLCYSSSVPVSLSWILARLNSSFFVVASADSLVEHQFLLVRITNLCNLRFNQFIN